jgi:hypothetical protein
MMCIQELMTLQIVLQRVRITPFGVGEGFAGGGGG